MKTILLAVAILMASPAFVQEVEHTPTVDQCRADRAYWMSLAEKPDMHGADEVSYETLTGWVKERDKLIAEDAAGKR